MLFLSLKHIFDTFVGYSNRQIVEALTISPLIRKYTIRARFVLALIVYVKHISIDVGLTQITIFIDQKLGIAYNILQ